MTSLMPINSFPPSASTPPRALVVAHRLIARVLERFYWPMTQHALNWFCPASSRHGRPTPLPILQNCVQSFSTSELKVLHLTVRKFRWVHPVSQPRSSA